MTATRPSRANGRASRTTGPGTPAGRLTLGIDEAGRGPTIGPMVLAAVVLDGAAATSLRRAGLGDSKSYGTGARAEALRSEVYAAIKARAKMVLTTIVDHSEIDARVARGELNALEREVAARLIDRAQQALARRRLQIGRIIADGRRMFAALGQQFEGFESHDRADEKHTAVAAASVVAKVIRDAEFAAICRRYEADVGPIAGGGYVNEATRRWLRSYVEAFGRLPDEARQSWPYPYLDDLTRREAKKGRRAAR